MFPLHQYYLDLATRPDQEPLVAADDIFRTVWRFNFDEPGFCLLDLGPGIDSHKLRSSMLNLKQRLSEINILETGKQFLFRSMGRYDQQETTKLHLDGAPDEALLMLAYEPSKVRSRLFLADYTRCSFDLGIKPKEFLTDFNPMFHKGEELLARYVTELPQPAEDHARILLINNSTLPFTVNRTNPLGVMHKAEIVNPMVTERRIVNSVMLVMGEVGAKEPLCDDQQAEFVNTDKISPKVY
jgi:hypothetical protein